MNHLRKSGFHSFPIWSKSHYYQHNIIILESETDLLWGNLMTRLFVYDDELYLLQPNSARVLNRRPAGQIRPANQFSLALWSPLEYIEIYRKGSESGVHLALKQIFLTSFGPPWKIVENPCLSVFSPISSHWLKKCIIKTCHFLFLGGGELSCFRTANNYTQRHTPRFHIEGTLKYF